MERFSDTFRFSDWPNREIPNIAVGVYVIWHQNQLIYCGMSGRQIEKNRHKKKFGLVTRLASHASGRLSGDQFCVYVANRLVIPSLKPSEMECFASGELTLDVLTKQVIHDKLTYQFALLDTSEAAYRLESELRSGKVFSQKPLLNPL